MKKSIHIILVLLISFTGYALDVYPVEIVGTITIGDKEGEIMYDAVGLPGDGPLTAKIFTIGPDDNIYIFDKYQQELKLYSLELKFIKEYDLSKYFVLSIDWLKIDKNGDFIIIDSFALKKISNQNELLYKIDKKRLPDMILLDGNFFPYEDYIFFYDENGMIKCIDAIGNIMKDEQVKKLVQEIEASNLTRSFNEEEQEFKNKLSYFKDKNNLLIINNRALSTKDTLIIDKYYSFLRSNLKALNKRSNKNYDDIPNLTFIGYDISNNSYWRRTMYDGIYVFDMYGELITSFKKYNKNPPAIAPSGDIYFWEVKPEGVTFYKITRQW